VLVPSQRVVALFRPSSRRPGAVRTDELARSRDRGDRGRGVDALRRDAARRRRARSRAFLPRRSSVARETVVEARVTDAGGHPLAGAVVRAFVVDAEGQVFFAGEGRSGPDGLVPVFEALPRGEAWLVAYAREHARASTRVLVGGVRRSVTLAMRDGHALSARVVDDAGAPVDGASVQVQTTDPLPHVIVTGKDGVAVFERLGPPPWSVSATAEGYDPISRTGVYPAEAPLELRLDKLGGSRSPWSTQGVPEPFAEVLISGPGIWPARTTITDGAGEVLITGLFAGVYDLKAPRRSHLADRSQRAATAGQGDRANADARRGPLRHRSRHRRARAERGRRGAPVKGADVVLVEEGLSAFPVEAQSNEDGVAILGPITEGSHRERADASCRGSSERTQSPTTPSRSAPPRRRDPRRRPRRARLSGRGCDHRGLRYRSRRHAHPRVDRSIELPRRSLLTSRSQARCRSSARASSVMPGPIPRSRGRRTCSGAARPRGRSWVTAADGTFRASPIAPVAFSCSF
jgi:protocatechuate 3,4-dioxygenase beta subunit